MRNHTWTSVPKSQMPYHQAKPVHNERRENRRGIELGLVCLGANCFASRTNRFTTKGVKTDGKSNSDQSATEPNALPPGQISSQRKG